MDMWQFYQDDGSEAWHWRRIAEDGFDLESETGFESRTDCIADAMRNGYLGSGPGPLRNTEALPWRRSLSS